MVIMKTMLLAAGMLLIGCGSDPAQGPQGEQGRAGAVGTPGAQGPAGAKGEPGAAGKDGAQGPAGKDGVGGTLSGTRLKAQWLVGDDGSRSFLGWFDSTTGLACKYGVALDGKTRCVPPNSTGTNIYFADAACAQPFVVISDASGQIPPDPPLYQHVKGVGIDQYFKTGAKAPTPSLVYALPGGTCTVVNISDPSTLFFYEATVVDSASFVEGSIATD